MATYNSSPNVISNCVKSTEALQSSAAFFVPSPTPLLGLSSSSFAASASAIENHSYIDIQKNVPNLTHHVNSSSSYTYMEIKREPCQVSEVTTSNSLQSSNHHNSKTLSSTMTTMVKIESTSPKMPEMEKVGSQMHISNSVPVGIAVARKRPQESNLHPTSMQPPRDLNYFGIRVADIGGVASAGCGNIYFAGADLISGTRSEDMNTGIHNVNRSASTYWQYPNTFPIESVISMSPVGLQYSRDASRGQLVLLPAAAAMDSFQQAAFLWPPYMQQNPASALQSSPNFIFPSMSPQANAQSQPFGAPLQLLGSNYLTAATTAATSTLCHHSQTNGNRFVSVSSDTKRIEQSQKHSDMKIEDWSSEHNVLNKNSLISHHTATSRVDKSKVDSEPNNLEMLANTNLVGAMPTLLHHEQPHNMISHNTPDFINMPILPSNFIATPDTTPLTPPDINQDVVGAIYKNSTLRVPSFSKTPEMQDVNVQTDTPVCSEDENSSLEISATENMSCSIQNPEKNKSISNLPSTQCHNNFGGCKTLLKENASEPLQMYAPSNDYSNENMSYVMQGKCPFENECAPVNKSKCFNSDNPIVLPSADSSSFKTSNPQLLEMSGLELLSNISTGSFVSHNSLKTVCVKQEPSEFLENDHRNQTLNNYEPYVNSGNNLNAQYPNPSEQKEIQSTIHSSVENSEPLLGGLNLLCALAEQRIHEEVESNNYNNPVEEHISEVKKRKHKHSKTKSSRKSRYYKKNKKKYAKERKEYIKAAGLKSDCVDVHENLRGAFKKVDSNYKKLNKWPDPEEFFKAMESDMRMRLADITRQYRKKKRKLDEISKIKKRKKASSSEYKFANISCKNPNFICFLDQFQSTSSNFPPPAETNESPLKTMRAKISSERAPETGEDYKETPHNEGGYPSKFKKRTSSHNSTLGEKIRCKESKGKRKQSSEVDRNAVGSRLPTSECQQPATVIKSEDQVAIEIDKQLVLSNDHLYRKETRVLTDMGGLFYAGILKPLQPPDVYAITLDGERGNKSHIMSREEIFKDTILEVVPKTIEEVPTGTRLCAYWSQQYRCLYPGRAIDSETSDIGSDFVSVEFDDGDSGRIRLKNIRFLLSHYPIVEYSENPFNALGKNKKSATIKSTSVDTMPNESFKGEMREPFIQESNPDAYTHKIDKKKSQFDNNLQSTSNLSECVRKHRKHKKRKKHKKHHRKSSTKTSTSIIDNNDQNDEEVTQPIQEGEAPNFDFKGINNCQLNANDCEPEKLLNINEEQKRDQTLLNEHVKNEAIGLDDDDSTSNVVSDISDEAKPNEKIDYNNGKGSKIAAFLPERQLWGWLGQAYRKAGLKGRARKQFYKSITRGKETITVGECAVFLSTGRPDRPYIGRIEAMWETTSSNKVVRVRWFYHPEETTGCPILKYPGALFDSPHEDENDVQTISHRCEVIEFSMYIAKFGSDTRQYQSIYDNNDTYYLSGYYNPRLQILKLQPDIPTEVNTSV